MRQPSQSMSRTSTRAGSLRHRTGREEARPQQQEGGRSRNATFIVEAGRPGPRVCEGDGEFQREGPVGAGGIEVGLREGAGTERAVQRAQLIAAPEGDGIGRLHLASKRVREDPGSDRAPHNAQGQTGLVGPIDLAFLDPEDAVPPRACPCCVNRPGMTRASTRTTRWS